MLLLVFVFWSVFFLVTRCNCELSVFTCTCNLANYNAIINCILAMYSARLSILKDLVNCLIMSILLEYNFGYIVRFSS